MYIHRMCYEDCGRQCPDGQFISDTCGADVRQGDVCCCKGNFLILFLTHRVTIYARIIYRMQLNCNPTCNVMTETNVAANVVQC